MLGLWMCLSVFYVLLCGVSGDEAVSLNCRPNVTVTRGGTLTLNCSINVTKECPNIGKCTIKTNMSVEKEYSNCSNGSNLLLDIANVTTEENCAVTLEAGCGLHSSTIKVQVTDERPTKGESYGEPHGTYQGDTYVPFVAVGAVAVIVVGLLCFLFKTDRLTKNNRYIRDVHEGSSLPRSASEDSDLNLV